MANKERKTASPKTLLHCAARSLNLRYRQVVDDMAYWEQLHAIYWRDTYQKQLDTVKGDISQPLEFDPAETGETQLDNAKKSILYATKMAANFETELAGADEPETLANLLARYKAQGDLLGSENEMGFQDRWGDFRVAFQQRMVPEYRDFLERVDIIARDCYYPLLKAVEKITGHSPTWLSPMTVLELSKIYRIRSTRQSPIPYLAIPFDRISNPWNLCAIHHEVAHDFFDQLSKEEPPAAEHQGLFQQQVKQKMDQLPLAHLFDQLDTALSGELPADLATRLQTDVPEWAGHLPQELLQRWSARLNLPGALSPTAKSTGQFFQECFLALFDSLSANLPKEQRQIAVVWQFIQLITLMNTRLPAGYVGWLEELFADMVGLMLAGPTYLSSLQEILLKDQVFTDFEERYPATYLRILFNVLFARQKLGYKTEAQTLLWRWHALFGKNTHMRDKLRAEAEQLLAQERPRIKPHFRVDKLTATGLKDWLTCLIDACWEAELGQAGQGLTLRQIYHQMEAQEYAERFGQPPQQKTRLSQSDSEKLRRAIQKDIDGAVKQLAKFELAGCRPRYLVPALRLTFEAKITAKNPPKNWDTQLTRTFLDSISESPTVTNAFRSPTAP